MRPVLLHARLSLVVLLFLCTWAARGMAADVTAGPNSPGAVEQKREPLWEQQQQQPHASQRLLQQQQQPTPAPPASSVAERHKHLLPVAPRDVVLLLLAFIVLALAAGAGIGGGVLLVPLLSLVGGFHFIETVALSNVTIFAAAVANMAFNIGRRNPLRPGPLIDYDLLLLFGPPIVIGSLAGSQLNYFIPSYITKLLLLAVLAPMTWRMLRKALLLWQAENTAAHLPCPPSKLSALPSFDKAIQADADAACSISPSGACHASPGASGRHLEQLPAAAPPANTSAAVGRSATNPEACCVTINGLAGTASAPEPMSAQTPTSASAGLDTPSPGHGVGAVAHRMRMTSGTLRRQVTVAVRDMAREMSPANQTSSGAVIGMLGPELMLLTSPASAQAAVQLRRLGGSNGRLGGNSGRRGSARLSYAGSSRQPSSSSLAGPPSRGDRAAPSPQDSAAAGDAADGDDDAITTPFELHQHQLLVRQETLRHSGTLRRLATGVRPNQHHHMSTKDSLQGPQGSSLSPASSGRLQPDCKSVDQGPARGQQQQHHDHQQHHQQHLPPCREGLPEVARSRCARLDHSACLHTPDLDAIMEEKMERHADAQYPKLHLGALVAMLLVVVLANILGRKFLTCGTWQSWLVVMSPLPVMCLVWAGMRHHVLWRMGWEEFLEVVGACGIYWNRINTLIFPGIAITAGLLAGLLGLGGGTVLAPLLLELGVHPVTAAASSQAAMLLSSCSASVVYLVAQDVPGDYGVAMALVGLCATLVGQVVVGYVVVKTGRTSLLVFILTGLFVAALGAGVAVASIALAQVVANPALLTATRAHDLCNTRPA